MAQGLFTLRQVNQAIRQGAWSAFNPPQFVEYLVVAGGGGGATSTGSVITGGGGAGGLLTGIFLVTAGTSYTVTVGGGGVAGTNGVSSVFGSISTTGGGASTQGDPSNSGGSGGGGTTSGSNFSNGLGVSGQGNNGGKTTGSTTCASGGGGAGTVGINGIGSSTAGNGGAGIASSISGTVTAYAGGGGGGSRSDFPAGAGGAGGGGAGALGNNVTATAGTVNTGGGGGGNGQLVSVGTGGTGGSGGSGIVVVRYPGNIVFYTGGTVNYNNGYIIHIFNSNGTLAPATPEAYNTSYQISRSLRFNSADSAYLNRTPATTTNRRTFTWSAWVKLSAFTAARRLFSARVGTTGDQTFIQAASDDTFLIGGNSGGYELRTTPVFRDPSAWYHVVLAFDTTQATSSNRIKLYVNGSQVTALQTATYPSQNLDTFVNATNLHSLGAESGVPSEFLNGYMTEVNFIDGQQLTPSSFGATSTTNGVWAPIKYTGTYGTNGFYLNFSDNSNTTAATLGKDYSGNGNNFTPNNFSVTAGVGNDSMVDVPTIYGFDTGVGGEVRGNYSTMNPVNKGSTVTLSNGNLDQLTASGGWNSARASIAVASGKWYWEVTITGTTQSVMHGVDDNTYNVTTNPSSSYVGAYTNSWGVYASNGQKRNNTGSGTAYGSAFAQNDVMIVAMDMDSGKIWWGKNGTWFASGDPVAGTNAGYTNLSGYTLNPATSGFDTTDTCTHNFGQRPFAYTAPSGYKALNTQNLPTPTIGATSATLAGKFFNSVIYTGTGANPRTITGVGFQPDWVWGKSRGSVNNNLLFDVVRGVSPTSALGLLTDTTGVEGNYYTLNGGVTAFTSDGFTVSGGSTNNNLNSSGINYVAWNWKAGNNPAGSYNTAGSITSSVSASITSGFSIVTYNGTGANATVGHGLGVAPSMILIKSRSSVTNWNSYHIAVGASACIVLNSTIGAASGTSFFNATSPTSTVFSLGTDGSTNPSGAQQVAYCFAPIAGYSAFGSYTGNGSAYGPFVFTGFRPAFVMAKRTDGVGDWWIVDDTRSAYNQTANVLYPNNSDAEYAGTGFNSIDILANGFTVRTTNTSSNQSGATYIYMAFAESPFKYSLAR